MHHDRATKDARRQHGWRLLLCLADRAEAASYIAAYKDLAGVAHGVWTRLAIHGWGIPYAEISDAAWVLPLWCFPWITVATARGAAAGNTSPACAPFCTHKEGRAVRLKPPDANYCTTCCQVCPSLCLRHLP